MWPLLRAELSYRRGLLTGTIVVAMPLAAVYATIMSGTPIGGLLMTSLPFVLAMGLLAGVFARHEGERRERLHILLPVTARQVGMSRAILAIGPFCMALGAYSLTLRLVAPEVQSRMPWPFYFNYAIIPLFMGVTLVLQDLFADLSRRAFKARMGVAVGLLILIFGLGAYVAVTPGQPHPVLQRVFNAPPKLLESRVGQLLLVCVSLAVAGLCVFTYGRRRSYLHT